MNKENKKLKWKPACKIVSRININMKTGKTKYTYIIPKTREEEERFEKFQAERFGEYYKMLLGDNFNSFISICDHLIKKLGDNFMKEYEKAKKELTREELDSDGQLVHVIMKLSKKYILKGQRKHK